MRILHAPTDVGNQAWGVSTGERRLGYSSRVLVYTQHFPGFGYDDNLHFERLSRIGRLASASRYFLSAIPRFDIFHFYFATSFFPGFPDVRLLKALGKKIFATFQGCDIRPGAACPPAVLDPAKHRHEDPVRQHRRLAFLLRHADGTYVLNPDLLDQSPTSKFLPYAIDSKRWKPAFRPYREGEEVIIFHAPSDRLVKGTEHVEWAVSQLRKLGYHVRLDLVINASHDEVIKRLSHAHLAIDQLLIGWYGAAAVEMMALGKPTVCFIQQEWRERVSYHRELPLINADRSTIVAVLRELLDRPERWTKIGEASRAFVERIHDPVAVARLTTRDYRVAFAKSSSMSTPPEAH